MPSRRSPKGLLKLPYSRKAFEKVRKRLGLKTAQKLARNGKLFRGGSDGITLSDLSHSLGADAASALFDAVKKSRAGSEISSGKNRKGKLLSEPVYTKVHPANTKRVYEHAQQAGEKLFQIRDGKIREFRSAAYQRQAHARLLNLKLRPFALQRQNLEQKLKGIFNDFKVNDFSDVQELHKHIPVLKNIADLRHELVKVNISIAEKKLDYYDRFPSRQNKPTVAKIEDALIDLEKLEDKLARQRKALNGIEGDLRLLVTQLKVRQKLSLELTAMLAKDNNAPENPTGEQLSNVLKITHLRERFHQARVNQFEAEMKLFHLYGVLFSGRTESAIKKDVIAAQERVREAIIKRRRLSRGE